MSEATSIEQQLIECRQEVADLQDQIERFAHNIQINIQGILADAEAVSFALALGKIELANQDSRDLVEKVTHLLITSNNIRPNLGDYELAPTSISKLIQLGISAFASYARERGIEITFIDLFEGNLIATVSRNHFQHVLHNVFHNAIKYSYARQNRPRTVDILLRMHNRDFFLIKVTNYGVPIDEDEIPLVIEGGYRGRHAQQRFRTGSGRGLYIANSIVKEHGGRLAVNSSPVKGGACVTTVSVFMPLTRR